MLIKNRTSSGAHTINNFAIIEDKMRMRNKKALIYLTGRQMRIKT